MARAGANKAKPQGRVYDLRKFAPEPIGFIADDGETYWISADPSVDMMAELLLLDNILRNRVDEIDDLDVEGMTDEAIEAELGLRLARSGIRAKELIVALAREHDPDVTNIPLKGGQLLQLLGLLVGGESVAEGIARDLTAGMAAMSEAEQLRLAAEAAAARERGGDTDAGPLASSGSSSRRSRASTGAPTGRTRGRPAGGGD